MLPTLINSSCRNSWTVLSCIEPCKLNSQPNTTQICGHINHIMLINHATGNANFQAQSPTVLLHHLSQNATYLNE